MDFNGLIRHYYLRHGANDADIRINFIEKTHREQQSHAMALRLRKGLKEIAGRFKANIKIVEIPPGPPVIATLVAEIHGRTLGQNYDMLMAAAPRVEGLMKEIKGVVDVDDTLLAPEEKKHFMTDRTKAALNNIADVHIARVLQGMVAGSEPASLRQGNQVNPPYIQLQLPKKQRALATDLDQLMIKGAMGEGVFLSELGAFQTGVIDQPIYHKDLQPVVHVFGDTAGLPPPEAVMELENKVTEHEAFLSAMLAAWPITLDPIFSGLAWALIFGIAVSTFFTLIVVPMVYFMAYGGKSDRNSNGKNGLKSEGVS